ncbi:MAG: Poxvirus G6 [Gammaproteobacteria bacterium]|nr:Poxvirus G6 [Gammaproteobacteria bacterium]
MPNYFIFFLLFIVSEYSLAACVAPDDISKQVNTEPAQLLDEDIESYYSLIEESLHHRAVSLELFKVLQTDLKENEYLSSANLNNFKQAIKTHIELRDRLYQMVGKRKCWLSKFPFTLKNLFPTSDIQKEEVRFTGIMLSLSAALNLYDNYLLIVSMFQEEEQLRRIIDQPDKGFGLSSNHLLDSSLAFNSVINREKVKQAIQYYQERIDLYLTSEFQGKKGHLLYLKGLIEQSPSYSILQTHSTLSFLQKKIQFYSTASSDSLDKLEKEGVNLLSLVFGNTVGLVETRKGKLYQNKNIHADIRHSLKAGDILLEKTPFRLTDQFIPGYWGHAAVWIGDEQELKALGLWDDPLVKPWQEKIKNGHAIVQALRSGVKLDPLNHFLNIDDMVVLRDQTMSENQLREVIINAFRQLGKAYDFNFDISSTDRIVCSELVYVSYLHIKWPTEKTLGRYTISPDHIAEKVKGDKLNVINLYLNGSKIDQNLSEMLIETLLP